MMAKQAPKSNVIDLGKATLTLTPSLRKTVNKVKVEFRGSLQIDNIRDASLKVDEALQSYDMLDIVLDQVSDLDLTYVQYFYHLRNTCSKAGKEVRIKANLPDYLSKTLTRSGLKNLIL